MFPFFGEKDLDILTSDIKIIDGIEQVRIYAESPDRTTGHFKKFKCTCLKRTLHYLKAIPKRN